ncbi:hypothetical protein SAMN04488068_1615 [Hydrocarboniphaga daqingensis]|uniref:Type IV pilus assembly protein PilW n=1 Tax=Hydrocarboniphaga daqingensis TaxID=490188 RepID=A0A1M5N4Z0_9GAMM|nr:hypothetical protein [Hydrocarboniphaga daqingensis]SHG84249.1 hypothetical protein SAMN04488068_1615 [Hydrocarboniphaga daqingensis]
MLTSQHGFSVTEAIIGLALGLLVITAGIALLTTTLTMHGSAVQRTRMNQDIRQIADALQRDAARAGSWGLAADVASVSMRHQLQLSADSGSIVAVAAAIDGATDTAAFAEPLSASVLEGRSLTALLRDVGGSTRPYTMQIDRRLDPQSLQISLPASSPPLPSRLIAAGSWTVLDPFDGMQVDGSCLLLSYDEDSNGQRNDSNERFGYRYHSADRVIRAVNNSASCSAGSWENISDERVLDVRSLALSLRSGMIGGATLSLQRPSLSWRLQVRSRRDSTMELRLQSTVAMRNDVHD